MKRTASAHWEGDLKTGKGALSTQSSVLNRTQYSYNTRFADGVGTNPEELLAAAHAGCYTMAVCAILSKSGIAATTLDTVAVVSMEGVTITGIHLAIRGSVPGITPEQFTEATQRAEKTCIISKALSVSITSEAVLI